MVTASAAPLSAITPSNVVAKISSARILMEIFLTFISRPFLTERSFLYQHHDVLPPRHNLLSLKRVTPQPRPVAHLDHYSWRAS